MFDNPRKIDRWHFACNTSESVPEKDILYKAL